MPTIRIGNGAGFWGDSPGVPQRLLETGKLDYLTLEYLAELTLSILAHQKRKNPNAGFVADVAQVVGAMAKVRSQGSQTRLVTNGGGMNPAACARDAARVLCENNESKVKIGIATGDEIHHRLAELRASGEQLVNLDSGADFESIADRIASANVYLGSDGVTEALDQGADIVLTGRIADAALVTGPCRHEFGWDANRLDELARATVAGHLIECGAQVTGGFFSDWDSSIDLANIGYPVAEIAETGESLITKPNGTGGVVNIATCAEQLVYEIGDPTAYLTPDVIADFSRVEFKQVGTDRVQVHGGRANGIPETLKASIAYYDGFQASGMIVIVGPNAEQKARAAGDAVFHKLEKDGITFEQKNVEVIGAGDTVPGLNLGSDHPWEVVLRVSARSPNREFTDRLGRELAPLVTSGPPGVTGYTGARFRSTPVLAFWPTLISRDHFEHKVEVKTAHEWSSKDLAHS